MMNYLASISKTARLSVALFMATSLVLLTLTSCGTSKKTGKQTAFGKAYHNIAGHYNYYFNAREITNISKDKIAETHKDNYNKVLELYKYVSADDAKAEASKLDDAIKRATINISLHPKSNFADDSYLYTGIAQYLKADYKEAEIAFSYIVVNLDPKKLAAERKLNKKEIAKKNKETKAAAQDAREEKAAIVKKENNNKKKEAAQKAKTQKKAREEKIKEQKKAREEKIKEQKRNKGKKNTTKDNNATKTPPKTADPDLKETAPKPINEKVAAAARAKEDEDKDLHYDTNGKRIRRRTYFLKHRPVWEDAKIWLARTYIEQERYDEAEGILKRMKEDFKLPKKLWRKLATVEAYSYLKQKNYPKATEILEKAIKRSRSLEDRRRMTFILAQIYDLQSNSEIAYEKYRKVLKMSPDFDMEFNTRLNLTTDALRSGKIKAPEAIAILKKMLRETKYEDFRDQIYYTLARLHMGEGEEDVAIGYYKKSLLANKTNKNQRVESYFVLAEWYWKKESFAVAKHYYDSTVQVMPPLDDRYAVCAQRNTDLTDLAKYIESLELNDSILRIAAMTEPERLAFGTKILEQRAAEKKAAAIAAAIEAANTDAATRTVGGNTLAKNVAGGVAASKEFDAMPTVGSAAVQNTPALGGWWAYDDANRKKGQRDFERKFGKRILIDGWRHIDQKDDPQAAAEANRPADDAIATTSIDPKEVEALFAAVPKNETEMEALQAKNTDALYHIGDLFRLRLIMPKNSIRAHERLLGRNPKKNPYEQEIFYTLFLNYTDLNNKPKADYYKNLLSQKYPDGLLTKVANDPTYLAELKKKQRALDDYYKRARDLLNVNKAHEALEMCMKSDSVWGKDNKLKAKFSLLGAMSRGNLNGKPDYITQLKTVVKTYPSTPEAIQATQMIQQLERDAAASGGGTKPASVVTDDFTYKPDAQHYVLVWIKDKDIAPEDLRSAQGDFNTKYYGLKKLKTTSVSPNLETRLLLTRSFDDAAAAMEYCRTAKMKGTEDFLGEKKIEIFTTPITSENYKIILRLGNIAAYETFATGVYK